MGMDIGLEESCNLALCTLVRRLAYLSHCLTRIEEWVRRFWKPLLGYFPEVLSLPRGWLGFVFKNLEDYALILEKLWKYDSGRLMIRRWRISFNPTTEYFIFRHLWVLLLSLPLHMQNFRALEVVGKSNGHLLSVDEASMNSFDQRMEKILVEVDIHESFIYA